MYTQKKIEIKKFDEWKHDREEMFATTLEGP